MNNKEKVIVIGGGLGGVSASISFASEGYSVELYEKNDQIGGKLNLLEKDGFKFDLGPSILTMPHIFYDLFDMAGKDMDDYVEIEKLDLQWRNFFEDDQVIDLYGDVDEIVKNNEILGKKDKKDLREFMDYSNNLYDAAEDSYFNKGLDNLWEVLKNHGFIRSLWDFDYFNTMHEGVDKRISNDYLTHIMDFFVKYVGSSPYDAPAVLNLLPFVQFEYGLWYVSGGMYNLAEGLKEAMKDLDIEINLNTEIVNINTENNSVKSIETENNELIEGEIFVSNMEVIPTYRELLEDQSIVKRYEKKFEPSCSGYVIHLGVDRRYDQLAHHNFFFSKDPKDHFDSVYNDKKLPEDPTIYLVASTRTDESQAPEGCENIKILPHIPHIEEESFTEEEFAEFKENVLDKLERMGLEDLRDHIITEDIWKPEDIKKNYYSNKGSIYGVVSDKGKNKGFKAPKESEKYNNLYFVGGSVNPGGGMPMVTLSGKQVRNKFIEEK